MIEGYLIPPQMTWYKTMGMTILKDKELLFNLRISNWLTHNKYVHDLNMYVKADKVSYEEYMIRGVGFSIPTEVFATIFMNENIPKDTHLNRCAFSLEIPITKVTHEMRTNYKQKIHFQNYSGV